MAELTYQTRSGASTYGKPRVYISFFEPDRQGIVEELCSDVLNAGSYALFLYRDGVIPEDAETLETELSQMQLFVLVCTAGYLSEENRSRDAEIRFALGHGIPLLPVVLSDNVIDAFNDLCAGLGIESLHCLDRNEYAGNDKGYRDRLKEYLEYFLIDDADVSRIREQFRSCIFLSYRKKDRVYARDLIRRIHRLKKYYDIAVWYDDYLVPGRSFEDEIFAAMDASDLFILAVTPNIYARNALNEDNYVVRKEYPEAVKRGKRIVAAELEKADRNALMLRFENIPECVSAYDELALSGALTALDGSEKENDAAHRYYIGLAYLNGIQAEVDPERAFTLISSAADDGMEEAMDRLVRMYRSGIAVTRDYGKAIGWQQRIIDQAAMRVQKEDSVENVSSLLFRLGQMGNYRREIRDDEGAEETYTEMLETAEKYADLYHLSGLYRDVSVSCNKIGDICLERKDFGRAQHYFEKGWRAAGVLRDEKPDEVSQRDYAVSCQKLGQACEMQGSHGKAKEFFTEACSIVSGLMEKEPTASNIRDVYVLYGMLGDVSCKLHDAAGAEGYYRRSLKLRETVEKETGADWAKRDLSVIWEKLGDLYALTGQNREASDAYEQAVYSANELFEKTALPVHEEELSKICTKAGEYHLKVQDYDEAVYYLEAAMEIDEKRQGDASTAEYRRDLSVVYNRLAMVFRETGETDRAREYYLKDYRISKELAETTGTEEARRDYELSCNYLGGVCRDLGEETAAGRYYAEGISAAEELVRETDDPVHRDDLAVLCYNFCRVTYDSELLRKACGIWERLHREHPENTTWAERFALVQSILQTGYE